MEQEANDQTRMFGRDAIESYENMYQLAKKWEVPSLDCDLVFINYDKEARAQLIQSLKKWALNYRFWTSELATQEDSI